MTGWLPSVRFIPSIGFRTPASAKKNPVQSHPTQAKITDPTSKPDPPKETPKSAPKRLDQGIVRCIMPGYTGLGRTGSRPGSRMASHSSFRWRLMFGCQETEGVSANPGEPVRDRIGVSSKRTEHSGCSGDGWPFRVSKDIAIQMQFVVTGLIASCGKTARPTVVVAVNRD